MEMPDTSAVLMMLLNGKVPLEHREMLFRDICLDESEKARQIMRKVLDEATARSSKHFEKKVKELQERIDELNRGPLRPAAFIGKDNNGRAIVCFEDGTTAIVAIADKKLHEQLRLGNAVLLDKAGNAVVAEGLNLFNSGQEALWLRSVDRDLIEVELRDEKFVFHMSASLKEKYEKGEARPGCSVIVSPRQKIAFKAMPKEERLGNFMFLDNSPVPDVVIERDIAHPPSFIFALNEHVRAALISPEILSKYKLPLTKTILLTGPSGTGKSLCIAGMIRRILETISETIGIPLSKLPPRVMRMKTDKLLNEWLGRSDKLIARFFEEATELYDKAVCGADGKEYNLPVIAVGEECDAFSRRRGSDHDSIMDRLQTAFLQGLDPARPEYKTRQIIFAFTSNVPELIDAAFLRRAGGSIYYFKRLTRRTAFQAVLEKHLSGLPFAGNNGSDQATLEKQMSQDITSWLFSPNSEKQELVELRCAGSETLLKSMRDFLTGALVERAVHAAAEQAYQSEVNGCKNPGLTMDSLVKAFDDQINGIVGQLSERNIASYVDLPEGTRVTSLRRLIKPSHLPFEFMRAS